MPTWGHLPIESTAWAVLCVSVVAAEQKGAVSTTIIQVALAAILGLKKMQYLLVSIRRDAAKLRRDMRAVTPALCRLVHACVRVAVMQ